MTEGEFWTKYFQSVQMGKNQVTSTISNQPEDMTFAKLRTEDHEEPLLLKRKFKDIDPEVDISANEDSSPDQYGVVKDPNQVPLKLAKSLSIIRRYNKHSAAVLGDMRTEKPSREEDRDVISKDLQVQKVQETVPLNIEDQARYFEGRTDNNSIGSEVTQKTQRQELLKSFRSEIQNFSGSEKVSLPPSTLAISILSEVTNPKGNQNNKQNTNSDLSLPQDFKEKLGKYFGTTNELLRHFWSCYSLYVQFPLQPQKAASIIERIKTFYDSTELHKSLSPELKLQSNQLIAQIHNTMDKAIDRNVKPNK